MPLAVTPLAATLTVPAVPWKTAVCSLPAAELTQVTNVVFSESEKRLAVVISHVPVPPVPAVAPLLSHSKFIELPTVALPRDQLWVATLSAAPVQFPLLDVAAMRNCFVPVRVPV